MFVFFRPSPSRGGEVLSGRSRALGSASGGRASAPRPRSFRVPEADARAGAQEAEQSTPLTPHLTPLHLRASLLSLLRSPRNAPDRWPSPRGPAASRCTAELPEVRPQPRGQVLPLPPVFQPRNRRGEAQRGPRPPTCRASRSGNQRPQDGRVFQDSDASFYVH